jgi:hypothetical protein
MIRYFQLHLSWTRLLTALDTGFARMVPGQAMQMSRIPLHAKVAPTTGQHHQMRAARLAQRVADR